MSQLPKLYVCKLKKQLVCDSEKKHCIVTYKLLICEYICCFIKCLYTKVVCDFKQIQKNTAFEQDMGKLKTESCKPKQFKNLNSEGSHCN